MHWGMHAVRIQVIQEQGQRRNSRNLEELNVGLSVEHSQLRWNPTYMSSPSLLLLCNHQRSLREAPKPP